MIDAASKRQRPDGDDFDVWPENWDSFLFFHSLRTQWRIAAGMGGVLWLGIDYGAVESVMNLRSIAKKRRAALFQDLQTMEHAALEVLNA